MKHRLHIYHSKVKGVFENKQPQLHDRAPPHHLLFSNSHYGDLIFKTFNFLV